MGLTGTYMADLNESDIETTSESKSTQKDQVYTSLTQGDKAWLERLAERNDVSTSEALRTLVHNARMRENIDGKEIII